MLPSQLLHKDISDRVGGLSECLHRILSAIDYTFTVGVLSGFSCHVLILYWFQTKNTLSEVYWESSSLQICFWRGWASNSIT